MPDTHFSWVMRLLVAWALISLGSAVVALYARPREFYRGFWFMSGLWGLIDGLIALFSLFGKPLPDNELHDILGLNLMLDGAYLVVGLVLATRSKEVVRGFGVAILAQGAFLLVFDAVYWFLTNTPAATP